MCDLSKQEIIKLEKASEDLRTGKKKPSRVWEVVENEDGTKASHLRVDNKELYTTPDEVD